MRGARERAQKAGMGLAPPGSRPDACRAPGAPHPSLAKRTEGETSRAGASGSGADPASRPPGSPGPCGTKAAGAGHPVLIGTGEAPGRPPDSRGAPCTRRPPSSSAQRAGRGPLPRPPRSRPRPPGRCPAGAEGSARPGPTCQRCARVAAPGAPAGGGADCALRSAPASRPPARPAGTSASPAPALGPRPPSSVRGQRPALPRGATLEPRTDPATAGQA